MNVMGQKLTIDDIKHVNIVTWIMENKVITENEKLIDFTNHRYMIQPYTDMSPEQWWLKCAQTVGGTTANMIKSAYLPIHYGLNGIYVLPTRTVVKDFVKPKVNKLYQNNECISKYLVSDSENLKQLGNRFVYFRGAFSDTEAIGIQADFVIGDEYDRSNQQVLKTYRSRLDASDWRLFWCFSNPSIPNFGVDAGFQASDQMHWFITCHHCGHEWFIDYKPSSDHNHYVEIISRERGAEEGYYACGNPKCVDANGRRRALSNADRQNGRWVAKHPNRRVRGYWFSQMMAPQVPARKIIADDTDDQAFFHNFTLGKAYVSADAKVTRQMILNNYVRDEPKLGRRYLGIDTGKDMHWMLGDDEGAIAWGSTRDWDFLESMIVSNQALTVIDPNPNPRKPLELVEKYPALVHLNYYVEDTKSSKISVWAKDSNEVKQNTILTDRTRAFDRHLYNLGSNGTMYKNENQNELEIVIEHWDNLNRIIEENAKGFQRAVWRRPQGKPDHLAHSNIYMEIAREEGKGLAGAGIVRSHNPTMAGVKTAERYMHVDPENSTIKVDIDPLEVARKNMRKSNKWG